MKNKPFALAMVICDDIIEDASTNKKSLIGIFNYISASTFPCVHSQMHIFISLTDGRGKVSGKLTCVKKDSFKSILQLDGHINFRDGMSVIELNFDIRNIQFAEPGVYTFDFLCNDESVISRDFSVINKK